MLAKFCTILAVLSLAASSLYAEPRKDRTVVVISLDAFPAYALNDSRLPVPTIKALASEGASAESMKPINPTITWPNHTTLVTGVNAGKHHVMFNGLLTYPAPNKPVEIEPWRDKDIMVGAETVYDIAAKAGLTTAQVDWVAIYNARTINWKFPEKPDPHGLIETAMVKQGVVTEAQLSDFNEGSQAWRDHVWTDAAAYILRKYKPNLMLVHLLDLDSTQHEYGPMNAAAFNAMAFLDDRVKEIVDAVRASGRLDNTTFLIVSDHGSREAKLAMHPDVLLKQNDIVRGTSDKLDVDAWVVPEGGCAMVYVTDPAKKAMLVPRLSKLFANAEGVAHVYGQDEYAAIGLPLSKDSNQAPDLFLSAREGYYFDDGVDGAYIEKVYQNGSHGYMNNDPKMQEIFIATGAGIRKGVRLKPISNLDVAPTIAALLGIQMPNTDGKVLDSILSDHETKHTEHGSEQRQ